MYKIQELAHLLYNKTIGGMEYFFHKSIVIVGDNSSGKSTLLKNLLDKIIEGNREEFYYIDSRNRVVVDHLNENLSLRYSDFDIHSIIKTRRDPDYFAKADYFAKGFSGGVATFSELMADLDGYNELFANFLPWTLKKSSILNDSTLLGGSETVLINEKIDIGSVSSSEAAKIRLIMEINYAYAKGCKAVIIDEFDDHFDTDNMIFFMEQLQKYYDKLRFIFVIHNFEVLVRLNNLDAVIYNNERTSSAEIFPLDCDDITELGQVYKIRSKYIGEKTTTEILLAECMTDIVKKGKFSEENKKQYLLLKRDELTVKGKIIYDYIERYRKDES